ncbi:hypothetical protein KSF_004730 [Reticulibacter mediterranei]|uniref:PLL-like beta propeller domain-containing protein n=1 Tax=Reticulibacter mediterranei TaxID=2778369 RepID=A0A8J3IDG4_9CHLR|nr:hypothetical protein [Reticulibacter mediterranei]GHO90425.1 hypothetical protein KSF_004730 [Reticulibacter mediterranei]
MLVERGRSAHYHVVRLLRLALTLGAAWLLSGFMVFLLATVPAYAHTTSSTSDATTEQGSTTVNVKTATGSVMRQDVFARGPNNTLAHRWRTVGTHTWTPWKLLDLHLASAPTAIQNPDPFHSQGVIHVFYNTQANSDHTSSIERIGLDLNGNMVFHENLFSRPCEHSFGGFCAPSHLGIISAPAVLSRGQLHLGYYHEEVFALEDAHTMVHRWLVANDGRGYVWSDWKVLSRANYVGDPAAISLGPNRMDVFIRSTDNHIYDKTYNGSWGLWQDLGGDYQSSPTVTSLAAGSMMLFALTNNTISGRTFSNGSWGAWGKADPTGGASGTIGASRAGFSGQVDLFVPDSGGFLWLHSDYLNGNNAEIQLLGGGQITSAPAALVWSYSA